MNTYGNDWTVIALSIIVFMITGTIALNCGLIAYKRMINSKNKEVRRNWSFIFMFILILVTLFIGIMIGASF